MSRYTAQVIACAWCCIFGAFERAASSRPGTCDHWRSVRHAGRILHVVDSSWSLRCLPWRRWDLAQAHCARLFLCCCGHLLCACSRCVGCRRTTPSPRQTARQRCVSCWHRKVMHLGSTKWRLPPAPWARPASVHIASQRSLQQVPKLRVDPYLFPLRLHLRLRYSPTCTGPMGSRRARSRGSL